MKLAGAYISLELDLRSIYATDSCSLHPLSVFTARRNCWSNSSRVDRDGACLPIFFLLFL